MSFMEGFKRGLVKAGMVCIGLAPAGCHYSVTSPALFGHGSSAAFDCSIGMWIACIYFFGAMVVSACRLRV